MNFKFDRRANATRFQPWWNDDHTSVLLDSDRARIEKVSPGYLNDVIAIRKYTGLKAARIAVVKGVDAGSSIVGRVFWFEADGTTTYW